MSSEEVIPINKVKKKTKKLKLTEKTLETKFDELALQSKDLKDEEYNKLLNEKELLERNFLQANSSKYSYLYPNLNDPNFNVKIAEKKEFNDTKYDGKIYEINEQAEKLCNAEFELSPHQQFIKNFLSFQTPYNSLLLYHGLGSGKTCSAIGVAEEMRDYINQIGSNQKIIVIASPNVQENFKLQLFDESKLKLVDGLWNIKSCVGNKFLKEINPTNMKGLSKERIVLQIKRLIDNSYWFVGYTEFANKIIKLSDIGNELGSNRENVIKKKLQKYFNNSLIIIDEVHNIRITEDNKKKRVAQELFKLVNYVNNLRLLFLSATPLYNTYNEIIWLINIMNLNDGRSQVTTKEIFDSDGNFKVDSDGSEVGKELLQRKATGYISYVRGDNPYTFPYRIWPEQFREENTLKNFKLPLFQLNSKRIEDNIQYLSLYINKLGVYQNIGYNYILNKLKNENSEKFDNLESLGYILLQRPVEALNIIYPNSKLDMDEDINIPLEELVGKSGLNNIMTYTESLSPPSKSNFEYKDETMYGRIFSPSQIGKYSAKIKEICSNILNSDGIVLIYSQYLDGGVIPIALALEELGLTRYGDTKSLFKTAPVEPLDLKTYTNSIYEGSISAKYTMITGDPMLSPDSNKRGDYLALTNKNNSNGHTIKVVLITQAGSEGIDLKNIRQVHVLEPWFNMSRIEQIIGRAVRNCSHKHLSFENRNVQIFLYGSVLEDDEQEAADLYIYRLAEKKAIQIGKVNRILKEISIDCLLNNEQLNFTSENMNKTVVQKLSNGKVINYTVGDKPYTAVCDYLDSCIYECKPKNTIGDINMLSYGKTFIEMNSDRIIERIRSLMKERYFYEKKILIKHINANKSYPILHIYNALDFLVNNNTEFIVDKYGRLGNLVNIGEYYLFQPIEISDKNISIYNRKAPIPFKPNKITFTLPDKIIDVSEEKDRKEEDTQEKVKDIKSDNSDQEINLDKETLFNDGKKILDSMFENYKIANNKQLIVRGEDNWYKYAYVVIKELREEGFNHAILEENLISHLIEMIIFDDLLKILNYLYNNKLNDFEQKIKNYFESIELNDKELKGIILQKQGKQQLVILNKTTNKWKLGEPEDYNDLASIIADNIIPIQSLNDIVGFIGYFKDNFMIFKVKQLTKKRNKGARCDQAGKSDTLKLLNLIVGYNKYTVDNTKGINQKQLCVLQEFILRLYNYDKKDDKIWFLDPFQSVVINIEKIER